MTTLATVQRAAKAPVLKHGEGGFLHARLVIKLSAVRDGAALDLRLLLLADKAGVEP